MTRWYMGLGDKVIDEKMKKKKKEIQRQGRECWDYSGS